MSEMIERVAKAIEKSYEGRHWDLEAMATAAIEAMREPTQAMVTAVDVSIPTESQIIDTWSTMIDAALRGN